MPLVIILVIVLGAIILIRYRRAADTAQRRATGAADAASADSVPVCRIVALGTSGSGKTLFLSSMFQHLQLASPIGSYFLSTDLQTRRLLGGIYREVLAPDPRSWPSGTAPGDMREFTFECMARDGGQTMPVVRFEYLDYAGELLEDSPGGPDRALESSTQRLERHVAQADALLGVIDGGRLWRCMRRDPEAIEYFQGAMQIIIGVMSAHPGPIHLVITKWDLFGEDDLRRELNDKELLELAVEFLRDRTDLGKLMTHRQQQQRIMRVIPVSALGNSFVALDEHGAVVKRPLGRIEPYNLDLPLAVLIPDLVRSRLLAELAAADSASLRENLSDALADLAKGVSLPTGMALRALLIGLSGNVMAASGVADSLIEWMSRTSTERRARKASDMANAVLLDRLRVAVLDEFAARASGLDATLPSSLVSGGLS